MLVNIFEVDQTTNEEVMTGWRCKFPEDISHGQVDDEDVAMIGRELAENGVAWVGGGAAQLFKITVEEGEPVDIHDDNDEPHGQREPFTATPQNGPTWTKHTARCQDCGRLFYVSQEYLNEQRASFQEECDRENVTDAQLASDCEYCLGCVDGESPAGEYVPEPEALMLTAQQMVAETIERAKQIVLTPVTFAWIASDHGNQSYVTLSGPRIQIAFPTHYFDGREVPQRITIESFVITEG